MELSSKNVVKQGTYTKLLRVSELNEDPVKSSTDKNNNSITMVPEEPLNEMDHFDKYSVRSGVRPSEHESSKRDEMPSFSLENREKERSFRGMRPTGLETQKRVSP